MSWNPLFGPQGRRTIRIRWSLCLATMAAMVATGQVRSDSLVRSIGPNAEPTYGIVSDGMVYALGGEVFQGMSGSWTGTGSGSPLSAVRLLAPVVPSKIVCFGWTYPTHAREVGGEPSRKEPLVFLKPPTVLIGAEDTVVVPWTLAGLVEFEGELAIVIGRRLKDVSPEEALAGVLGYTVFNDVTSRDLTRTDPEFTRGKGIDTFGPIGPMVVRGVDPSDLRIRTLLNGEVKQDARTSDMTFGIPFLISYISRVMTLLPGDVVATGTPGGTARMKSGDKVEILIEKVGRLRNVIR